MKKGKPILIVCFFLLAQNTFCQTIEEFDFMGSISTYDSMKFSYRLQFEIQNGRVKGYSITDYLGADETKTEITGTYNYDSKVVQYVESKLVYTKSKYESDLCFIHGKCTLGSKGKTAFLRGTFVGKYVNNDTCAAGNIVLMSTAYLMKKAKKIQKVIDKKQKANQDTLTDYEKIKYKNTTLKNNESITYEWNSDKLDLHIWDQGVEDGDKINVTVNGKLVLINYLIKKDQKVLPIQLKDGENIISIKALNEGATFPNTVSVSLQDGAKGYKIVTYLVTGSSANIVIQK